ncbi:MAG: ribbon-helix-helix protein, CopG family [Acidimicrobiales bacterium]|nr:ribbon-helix-helix protein, CopG family [Acidimicrobiales bacterium]
MPRVGRPPIGDRISVRLPESMLAALDERAQTAGVSRAGAVRLLLERALSASVDDGVDRTQIAQRLALTPAQRVSRMAEETRRMLALTGRAS